MSGSCGWSPMKHEDILAWVEAHQDSLPRTLAELSAFPIPFRKVIVNFVSPEARTAFWREHLTSFIGPDSALTQDQQTLVRDAIAELPLLFTTPRAEFEQRAKALENRMRGSAHPPSGRRDVRHGWTARTAGRAAAAGRRSAQAPSSRTAVALSVRTKRQTSCGVADSERAIASATRFQLTVSSLESTTSDGGEAVVLRFAIVLGGAPVAVDQSLMLEAIQRGIERALLNEQCAAGDLLDAKEHAVAVQLAERDRLQNEEVEGAGEDTRWICHALLLCRLGEARCRSPNVSRRSDAQKFDQPHFLSNAARISPSVFNSFASFATSCACSWQP